MSIALKPYEQLLRPAHEAWAALGWGASAIMTPVLGLSTNAPAGPFLGMTAISVGMAGMRALQTKKIWMTKIRLCGHGFSFMPVSTLKKLMESQPGSAWLGAGWDWGPSHTQRLYDLRKMDQSAILPPKWFLKHSGIVGQHLLKPYVGLPWIHGLADKESHIYVPLVTLEGHVLIFGTTGAGKTRLYETIIVQAILRGETVVIIDPKGDKELAETARNACLLAGRPEAYIEFNPAHPSKSIRLDPLRNWNNPSEIASRIAALMPADSEFTQMGWKAVNVVCEALVYIDEMPTLMKLRRNIEGGADKLMELALKAYFRRNVPHWESLLAPIVLKAADKSFPVKVSQIAALNAYISFYKTDIAEDRRCQEIDGLLSMIEHNREHLGKILASLVPLLVMLSSGEVGKLLSPDPTDINDHRPIFDTKKVVNGKHVLYLALNSLSNASVGSAIGSTVLADFAAVAGDRYNYENCKDKIHMLVDESAEVVNMPLIQILNKARGAGFITYLAAQTFPDFVARMGDEAKARQILGNCNNLIALRTKDRPTQDFIVESFGETDIQVVSRGMSSGVRPDQEDVAKNTNVTKNIQEKTVTFVPPEMLGNLPHLEYIASVAGGRLIKGRLPKLFEG